MSTALVKRSLQLIEETSDRNFNQDKKHNKKTKRNTGDIRKAIPIKIEKIKQNIHKESQDNVRKNLQALLRNEKYSKVTNNNSIKLLNKLTRKTSQINKKKKKKNRNNKSKSKQNKGSVFTEEDFAKIAGEIYD